MVSSSHSFPLDTSMPVNTEIRRLGELDAVAYSTFQTDPAIYSSFLEDGIRMDRSDSFLPELKSPFYFKIWGVFLNKDLVAIVRLHRQGVYHWEVFLACVKECRGKQMVKWTHEVMDRARVEFGSTRIILEARVASYNRASIHFTRQFGFYKTGVIPISAFRGGKLWDKWIFCRELV
jgi:hypothetical protein